MAFYFHDALLMLATPFFIALLYKFLLWLDRRRWSKQYNLQGWPAEHAYRAAKKHGVMMANHLRRLHRHA